MDRRARRVQGAVRRPCDGGHRPVDPAACAGPAGGGVARLGRLGGRQRLGRLNGLRLRVRGAARRGRTPSDRDPRRARGAQPQLHLGHDRPPQGRDVLASGRHPQRAGNGRAGRARQRCRVPVDAAHVPLQRLVLPLGGHRGGRHPRDAAGPGARRGVAPHPRGRGDPLQRRPHRADRPGQPSRRGAGAPHRAGGHGRRSPVADAAGPDGRAQHSRDPPLRAHRDLRPVADLRLAQRMGRPARRRSRPGSRPARGWARW